MKKFLAVSIIAVLYLSPLAAFAQRRSPEQTKSGKMAASYTYDSVNEEILTKSTGSNDKSVDGHYTTKIHGQFESSQIVKARHTNFVSIFDPLAPQGSGTYSITRSGEEHTVSSDDLHYDSTEESSYKGTVTEVGGIGMDFPDTGENVEGAEAGVSGTAVGASKKTSRMESWVYHPNTSKNEKQTTNETDNSCPDGETDSTKPPESRCAIKFTLGGRLATRKPADEEIQSGKIFSGASFLGSFATGQYKVSLTVTNKPVDQNTEADGRKNAFTETEVFTVTLTLAGKTAALFSPDKTSDPGFLADALLPGDRMRFLLRQSGA